MKFYNYVVIFIGILLLLNMAGYTPPASGTVKTLILNGHLQNIQSSALFVAILSALALAGGVGIVAGLYTSTPPIQYVIAGILSIFLSMFIVDIIWLYTKLLEHSNGTWLAGLITLILAPLIIGFIISSIEWWQGTD